jgi:hypothetical protein
MLKRITLAARAYLSVRIQAVHDMSTHSQPRVVTDVILWPVFHANEATITLYKIRTYFTGGQSFYFVLCVSRHHFIWLCLTFQHAVTLASYLEGNKIDVKVY